MDDDRLITCSTSMERWKSASPCLGTCRVVTGILNKMAMDLEFIKLPVKPLCSLIPSLSNICLLFFSALQWVMSTTMLSISSKVTSLSCLFPHNQSPSPCLTGSTWTSLVLPTHCYEHSANKKKFPVLG